METASGCTSRAKAAHCRSGCVSATTLSSILRGIGIDCVCRVCGVWSGTHPAGCCIATRAPGVDLLLLRHGRPALALALREPPAALVRFRLSSAPARIPSCGRLPRSRGRPSRLLLRCRRRTLLSRHPLLSPRRRLLLFPLSAPLARPLHHRALHSLSPAPLELRVAPHHHLLLLLCWALSAPAGLQVLLPPSHSRRPLPPVLACCTDASRLSVQRAPALSALADPPPLEPPLPALPSRFARRSPPLAAPRAAFLPITLAPCPPS
jgi:hypothetical protein